MKETRKYGLFFKSKDGRWIRLYPRLAFAKSQAVRIFQSRLLDLSCRGKCPMLRLVKVAESGNDLSSVIHARKITARSPLWNL